MSFHNINSFQYSNLNQNIINFGYVSLNKLEFEDNVQYKLNVVKQKQIELIDTYNLTLNNNFIESTTSKHPEKALTLSLEQGIYRIILKQFGIYNEEKNTFNTCIKSSKGKVKVSDCEFINEENKFDENDNLNYSNIKFKSINEFEFKMNKAGQFSIWIEANNKNDLIGNFEFYLIKILDSKIEEEDDSYIFLKNTYTTLNVTLKNNFLYSFEVYELKYDEPLFTPKYKYPEGNYQVTLNNTLITTTNNNLISSIKANDSKNFNTSFGRISGLNNISLPYNVNPLNYYYMIGKIEFLMYFDFISDSYYFQPVSFAECFMALYVPRSICKLVEQNENNTYAIFKITSYTLIHHDFKNESIIRENIKSWLNVENDKIHIDNYGLYYWIDVQNCDNSFYYNIVKELSNIEQFYTYIDLSINGNIYDDVSLPITENDNLDYSIINATFTKLDEKSNKFNFINWEKTGEWRNYNNTINLLYSEITGNGVIRITEQHFKNATGINLNSQSTGTLTKEQLIKLNINEPKLTPYNRFQYWLRTEKF